MLNEAYEFAYKGYKPPRPDFVGASDMDTKKEGVQTTRIITFLVGDPYKPSFSTVTMFTFRYDEFSMVQEFQTEEPCFRTTLVVLQKY